MRNTYKTPQGGPTEIAAEMPGCAGRNGAPTKLYWEGTEGGMGGAHDVLMANDDKYVGHFYVDADDSVDVQAVLRLIAAAPDLLEAAKQGLTALLCQDRYDADAVEALEDAIARATGVAS